MTPEERRLMEGLSYDICGLLNKILEQLDHLNTQVAAIEEHVDPDEKVVPK